MDRRQHTLATLVRWREFEQAKARSACQVRAAEVRRADLALEEAADLAHGLQAERTGVLATGFLDLARLGVVTDLEERAWTAHEACATRRSRAVEGHALAQAEHLGARARLNVAHAASERVDHEQRQVREKHQFDQLMDLLAAGRTP